MENKTRSSVAYFIEIKNTPDQLHCIDTKAIDLYTEYIRYCWEISTIPISKNIFYKEVVELGIDFYLDRNKCRVFRGVGAVIDYNKIRNNNKLSKRGKLILSLIGHGSRKISETLGISYTAASNRLSGVVDFSESEIIKLKKSKLL